MQLVILRRCGRGGGIQECSYFEKVRRSGWVHMYELRTCSTPRIGELMLAPSTCTGIQHTCILYMYIQE